MLAKHSTELRQCNVGKNCSASLIENSLNDSEFKIQYERLLFHPKWFERVRYILNRNIGLNFVQSNCQYTKLYPSNRQRWALFHQTIVHFVYFIQYLEIITTTTLEIFGISINRVQIKYIYESIRVKLFFEIEPWCGLSSHSLSLSFRTIANELKLSSDFVNLTSQFAWEECFQRGKLSAKTFTIPPKFKIGWVECVCCLCVLYRLQIVLLSIRSGLGHTNA